MSENGTPESTGEMRPRPQVENHKSAADTGSSPQPGEVNTLVVLGEILKELKGSTASARSQRILGIVAILIAILGLALDNRKSAERKEDQIEASRFFAITVPKDDAEVSHAQLVRGTTPLLDMNHYVVATLVRTGASYVQAEPVSLSMDGTFSGEARFDDIPVTDADELVIQVLATKSILEAGRLTKIPRDAILSTRVSARWAHSLPVASGQIVIAAPTNGVEVGLDGTISGTTTLRDLNHFIVVTPLKVGTAFVQDQAALVNPANGTFTGRARFGGAEVGVGELFAVRILATQSTLPSAPLIQVPADAVFSNSVTVRRGK